MVDTVNGILRDGLRDVSVNKAERKPSDNRNSDSSNPPPHTHTHIIVATLNSREDYLRYRIETRGNSGGKLGQLALIKPDKMLSPCKSN